jgi:hypothetical protein
MAADGSIQITVRLAGGADRTALERLAVLDAKALPGGPFVLGLVDGELVAALPVRGGRPVADPFRRTAEIVPLLELRAAQLRREAAVPPRRRVLARLRPRPAG